MESMVLLRKTKRNATMIAALLFALLLLAVLCSCAASNQKDATSENAPSSSVSSLSGDELEETTYSIKTPHGDLAFPEKWKDEIRVEQSDDAVSFYGTIGGKEIELFALYFGSTPDEGSYLGDLDGEEVYVVDMPVEFNDSWNGDDKQAIMEMQDNVNFIIQGLKDRGLSMA